MARPDADHLSAFAQYVLDRAVDLGLRDWEIKVQYRERGDGESNVASVDRPYARRCADIVFYDSHWDTDAAEQRATVVHELLHCHLDGPAAVVRDMFTQLGSIAHSILEDNHKRATEEACDAIATAIAGHYPLPPEPPE